MLTALLLAATTAIPVPPQATTSIASATSQSPAKSERAERMGLSSKPAVRPPAGGEFLGACLTTAGGIWGDALGDDTAMFDLIFGPGTYCWDNTAATTGTQGQSSSWCDYFGTEGIENDIWLAYFIAPTEPYVLEISTVGLTTVDTKIAVWEVPSTTDLSTATFPDPANGIIQLACDQNGATLQTTARFLVENTTTHTVVVQLGNFPGAAAGTGEIRFTEFPAQSLEGCAYDDGSSEEAIGASAGGDTVWLQAFDDSCGFTILDGVDIAVGALGQTDVPIGSTITVMLYDDPDDDYLPDDLVLLASGTGTVSSPHTDTLENFTFTGGSVSVNGVYFIGAFITHAAGVFPAAGDLQTRQVQRHFYWSNNQGGGAGGDPYHVARMPITVPFGNNVQWTGIGSISDEISVDPIREKVWNYRFQVESSDLDGLSPVVSGVTLPPQPSNGIGIDHVRDRMYILDTFGFGANNSVYDLSGNFLSSFPGGGGTTEVDVITGEVYVSEFVGDIRRLDSSGALINTVAMFQEATNIAVDGVNGRVYWTEFNSGGLFMANVDGTGQQQLALLDPGKDAWAVDVNPFGFLYWIEFDTTSADWDLVFANLDGTGATLYATVSPDTDHLPNGMDTDLLGERSYVAAFTSGTFDPANAFVPLSMNDLSLPYTWLMRPHEGAAVIPPANDDCADAIALPTSFATTPYDATNATTDGSDAAGFCDYGAFGDEINHNDIWFTYTPDVGGCTYITTLNLAAYDTRLTVYDGVMCPDDPAMILACVDDEVLPTATPFEAGLDVDLVAGNTYTIRLGTYSAATLPGAGSIMIAAGPGADVNSGGANPGAPGCTPFPEFCFGDGGDQMGCSDCPCSNNAPVGSGGGCLHSGGMGSRLMVSGDPSVSLPMASVDDLRFSMTNGAASQLYILNSGNALAPTMGPCAGLGSGAGGMAFDGLRCAIMQTLRNGGRGADVNGEVGVTNNPWGGESNPPGGIAQFFGYTAGTTKYFQCIHRDSAAVNCMTGLNTTQAIEVTFTP